MASIPREQMKMEIACLEKLSKIEPASQVDSLNMRIMKWFDHLAILKRVEVDITESKKFEVLGRKLHCWTPQLVVIRKWHRRCLLLLRAIRQGRWRRVRSLTSKMIASRLLIEEHVYNPDVEMDISSCFGGIQPLHPPQIDDTEEAWAEWITELGKIVEQLSSKLQGRYRKNQRLKTCMGMGKKTG